MTRSAADERADVLAYLTRKIGNAQRIIDSGNDHKNSAHDKRRAWEVVRDDIIAGLHEAGAEL